MKFAFAHFSHAGRESANQDSVLPPFDFSGTWWAAVADGMGGRPGGAAASATALETIAAKIRSGLSNLTELFAAAHTQLQDVASKNPHLESMGTTLSLIRFTDSVAEVGHVGDSRVYHLRGDGIVDRTVDQTEVEQLVQQGVLTRGRARRYPRRHILLSVLSPNRSYDLYQSDFEIQSGDRLILLTDGVSAKLLRKEIRDLSVGHSDPQSFCDALALEIEQRTPEDDYTAICIDVES
jgi:PPM family protein phosphatase